MSAGSIAAMAIITSAIEGLALIGALTWLIYSRRIVLAATPKPQQQAAGQPPGTGGES